MSDLKPTARQSAPPGALLGALAGIEGEWARTEAFERIAPQLAPSDLAAALAFARGRPELWMRTRALVALLHTQPQRYRWAFVRELLDMIDAQPNMAMRATAFDRVLPIVREGEISAVTQVARRVGPRALLSTAEAFAERCGAAVVSALAFEAWEGLVRELPTVLDDEVVSRVRGLPFTQAVALLQPDDTLRAARRADDAKEPLHRVLAWATLPPGLALEDGVSGLERALGALGRSRSEVVAVLAFVAEQAPASMVSALLDEALSLPWPTGRLQIIAALAPRLDADGILRAAREFLGQQGYIVSIRDDVPYAFYRRGAVLGALRAQIADRASELGVEGDEFRRLAHCAPER